jgi:hypothetical protein
MAVRSRCKKFALAEINIWRSSMRNLMSQLALGVEVSDLRRPKCRVHRRRPNNMRDDFSRAIAGKLCRETGVAKARQRAILGRLTTPSGKMQGNAA